MSAYRERPLRGDVLPYGKKQAQPNAPQAREGSGAEFAQHMGKGAADILTASGPDIARLSFDQELKLRRAYPRLESYGIWVGYHSGQ